MSEQCGSLTARSRKCARLVSLSEPSVNTPARDAHIVDQYPANHDTAFRPQKNQPVNGQNQTRNDADDNGGLENTP